MLNERWDRAVVDNWAGVGRLVYREREFDIDNLLVQLHFII